MSTQGLPSSDMPETSTAQLLSYFRPNSHRTKYSHHARSAHPRVEHTRITSPSRQAEQQRLAGSEPGLAVDAGTADRRRGSTEGGCGSGGAPHARTTRSRRADGKP